MDRNLSAVERQVERAANEPELGQLLIRAASGDRSAGSLLQAFTDSLYQAYGEDHGKDFLTSHILSHRREPPPGWDGIIALESK